VTLLERNKEGRIVLKGWTLKEIGYLILLTAIVSGIAGNTLYQNHLENQKKNQRIEKLQVEVTEYNSRLKDCLTSNKVFPIFYGTNPRSEERIQIAIEGFNKIISADCFVFGSKTIYSNPYKNLVLANLIKGPRSQNEEEIFQGLLYEIDQGIPYLVTGGSICADGSYSGSVGRGTCSWHGGYASQRGKNFGFKASEIELDPRIELSKLLE